MYIATLILILAGAMIFFYFQDTCRRILRRKFDRDYFWPVINANQLEFLSVRHAIQESNVPLEYSGFRVMLRCDYLVLRYLLKTCGNKERRYSKDDCFLMVYYCLTAFSLSFRHLVHLDECQAMLRMTSVLEYFSNVIGRRLNAANPGALSAAKFFLTLQ
jgi:hypothetical protein